MFNDTISFIKELYPNKSFIGLHEPVFMGNEKTYLCETIDSTFVSSVGPFVNRFELEFSQYIGHNAQTVVTSNGTAALHAALILVGVKTGDEVLTQALTFVATANAISYCGASPIFIDSEMATLGLSPNSLAEFLDQNAEVREGECFNKKTGKIIRACVPMHVFGHPVRINEIVKICQKYHIYVVEDAAEALGSLYQGKPLGIFGKIGVYSFNGNKIITSGGGGAIVTDDVALSQRAKHVTTTAKQPHPWDFAHDEIGFNYRMPNLNAALACAQLEKIQEFVENKRQTASFYKEFFDKKGINFFKEPEDAKSNYWLNVLIMESEKEKNTFLEATSRAGVMTRPIWKLMTDLPMYQHCQSTELPIAKYLSNRVVNIPSSVRVS